MIKERIINIKNKNLIRKKERKLQNKSHKTVDSEVTNS